MEQTHDDAFGSHRSPPAGPTGDSPPAASPDGYHPRQLALVLEALRRDGIFDRVVLCYVEGNDSARRLYERFGFVETDRDGDEIGMELSLS